jgi:endoglucanase
MKRRSFIKTTGLVAAGTGLAGSVTAGTLLNETKNKLPRWKGFNLLDYFSPGGGGGRSTTTDEDLKWMAGWGFDFVRLPMAYPRYITFDPSKNITPDDVMNFNEKELDNIQSLVERANKHGLHMSINLHRAPGFCVNAGFNEPYNLWQDKEAQEAFYQHWSMWAKRFKHLSPKQISFDLVNEPCTREDMNDQHSKRGAIPGELYREVAKNRWRPFAGTTPTIWLLPMGMRLAAKLFPKFLTLISGKAAAGIIRARFRITAPHGQ